VSNLAHRRHADVLRSRNRMIHRVRKGVRFARLCAVTSIVDLRSISFVRTYEFRRMRLNALTSLHPAGGSRLVFPPRAERWLGDASHKIMAGRSIKVPYKRPIKGATHQNYEIRPLRALLLGT